MIDIEVLSKERQIFSQLSDEHQRVLEPLSEGLNVLIHSGKSAQETYDVMVRFHPEAKEAMDALMQIP